MTTPNERTRALVQTGAFLKAICSDDAIPDAWRQEAARLLRHFPTVQQLQWMAAPQLVSIAGERLQAEHDPEWLRSYPQGAHVET